MTEKELEESCAEYVDECIQWEERFKIGEIPLGWYDQSLYPDSSYGLFKTYLFPDGIKKNIFKNGYLEFSLTFIKNILKIFIPFSFGRNPSKNNNIEDNSFFFFCDIPSGNSTNSLYSFLGRRKHHIKEIENKYNTLILVNFDSTIRNKEKEAILNQLFEEFSESRIINVDQEVKFKQITKNIFKAFTILIKNHYGLFKKINQGLEEFEYYFLTKIKKLSLGDLYHFLNQQVGYENIFSGVKNGVLVQTYSFLQIDRIPTYYANKYGLQTVSIGDRIYTSKRPSSCFKGKNHFVNKQCLPNKYYVQDKISKNTLIKLGISADNVFVNKKNENHNIFNEQKEKAVLIYLQRSRDNPIDLLKSVIDAVDNSNIEIVLKLHPRFLNVKKELEPLIHESDYKITIIDLDAIPQKNYFAAITVFSTAALGAFQSNIPVIWAPFLSFDSIFVSDMIKNIGISTENCSKFQRTLKKLCINNDFNNVIRKRQVVQLNEFWETDLKNQLKLTDLIN